MQPPDQQPPNSPYPGQPPYQPSPEQQPYNAPSPGQQPYYPSAAPDQPAYSPYPGQPGQQPYPPSSPYPNYPDQPATPGYPSSSPYPGQPGYPPSSPYPGQPGYPQTGQQPGAYPNQPPYPGQPSQPYPSSMPYPGQPGYPQTGQQPGGYPNQPYTGQPPTGYPQGGYPPPTPAKSRTGLIIGILAVVAVVVIAAVIGGLAVAGVFNHSSTASATATPTVPTFTPTPTVPTAPSPGPGFTTQTSSDGTFALNVPSGWIKQEGTSGAGDIIFTDNTNNAIILPTPSLLNASGYPSFLKTLLEALGANATVTQTTSTVRLGSNSWTKATGTFTFTAAGGSTPSKAAMYGTDHAGKTYIVLFFTDSALFAASDSSYFQTMLTSFTFLK